MAVRGSEWIDDISREDSPEAHDDSPEKRASKKRKVLSCYACRSRKMKCDRVYPVCGRCEKTGRSGQCTYDPRLLEESNIEGAGGLNGPIVLGESSVRTSRPHDATANSLEWQLRSQERLIESLERKLAAQESHGRLLQHGESTLKEPAHEEMMFRGKGFKTAFHGATSFMSLIAHHRELQSFTRLTLTVDHSIMRVKTEFKTYRDRRKLSAKEQSHRIRGTNEEVLAALPDKTIVDTQATLYFRTWETSYRVLHEPSFWTEYQQFWEQSEPAKRSTSFAVILLLIVAATKCVSAKDDVFIGDTTVDRQTSADIIEICDAWIFRQPRKRQAIHFFQMLCLSLIAKRSHCVKLKQDWINAGELVRLAMASGMHRDPELLPTGKITAFEMEMKKRIWATIMELELQSSVDAGLQSSLASLHFDNPAPSNLDDDTFSSATLAIPAARSLTHLTSSTYLALSRKSLPLRIQLTQLLNTPTSSIQYSDVLHYDTQIQAAIASLPRWEGQRSEVPTALLQMQLQQYLLLLHKPYANLARRDQRYAYSLTTIISTVDAIIAAHQGLLSRGVLAFHHFRNDVLRAGLALSQVTYENCDHTEVQSSQSAPGGYQTPFADPDIHVADITTHKHWTLPGAPLSLAALPSRSFLTRTLVVTSLELLDRTRQLYEHKVMRLGTGYMEFWLLSAAIGMLPPVPSSSTSIAYVTQPSDGMLSRCRKSLDCFTTLAFRVLALQQDPQTSFASSLRSTMASVSPSDERTPSTSVGIVAASDARSEPLDHLSFNVSNPDQSAISGDVSKDLDSTFGVLQDMQVDLGEWSFPDFWAFDLGGDY